jgi:hypothetical protein
MSRGEKVQTLPPWGKGSMTKPAGSKKKCKKPLDKYPYLWYNTNTRSEENKVACECVNLSGGVLETKTKFYSTKRSEDNFPALL